MKRILIIGAGRSSSALINYVLNKSTELDWQVTVADANLAAAEAKINGHSQGRATRLDVLNVQERRQLVGDADIVVSLLPAHLHIEVARDCILLSKHLVTASYVSKEIQALDQEARERGLLFMGEMGLDPGIDHMSAMQRLDHIREQGGTITAFRSFTGGVIAPESDDNPWHYKFTWNPRNVVLAGQGTAQYLEEGKLKFIPYSRLFENSWDFQVEGLGDMVGYANRDSLQYRKQYGLDDIPTILRGTLRYPGFCRSWNALIQIGLTDHSFVVPNSDKITYSQWLEALAPSGEGSVKARIAQLVGEDVDGEVMSNLDWLGLFSEEVIGLENATSALILEQLLLQKWALKPEDRDMIVMQHEIEYELDGSKYLDKSNLVLKGVDAQDTAMARTVGLPMGILVRLISEGKVSVTGVHIPNMKEVYEPVLEELKEYDANFIDVVTKID